MNLELAWLPAIWGNLFASTSHRLRLQVHGDTLWLFMLGLGIQTQVFNTALHSYPPSLLSSDCFFFGGESCFFLKGHFFICNFL